MKSIIVTLFTIVALSTASFAQNKKVKPTKSYDFSGDSIDGDLIRPDGDTLDVNDIASHTSLIKLRLEFIKEIIKSAANL